MATDKNKFDDWLKAKLYRDLLFRAVVWASISALAAYYAIDALGIKPLDYFDRMQQSLGKMINSLGSISLLLCLPALFFKDMEASVQNPRFKDYMRGHAAGFFRRLAGDLSLWSLGAVITMFSSFVIVVSRVEVKCTDYAAVVLVSSTMLVLICCIGFMNFFVRRVGPSPMLMLTCNLKILVPAYLIFMAAFMYVGSDSLIYS
ncbi:hypothetical protein [Pseudomonas syringae group genomosp. 3]|uniref:hypothetical protein n=1 Tax=Pseudomonas syringae group genomosp. 3 TaxID=251701 RepID=UPI000F0037B2|nr:hypothetical protein [Pseudomonas syringae group genomosp. 3]